MATPTTTPEAIRNKWITVIRALTPAAQSTIRFRPSKSVMPLDVWAEENPQACLRVFDITDTTEREDPSFWASNKDLEEAEYVAELLIAYPHKLAMYGLENRRDLQDMMRADADQIRKAIGINGAANYVSGECLCDARYTFETGDAMSMIVFTLETRYYFDVSAV